MSGRIARTGFSSLWSDFARLKISMIGLIIVVVGVIICVVVPLLPLPNPQSITWDIYFPPSLEYPMGTDHLGRDILIRVLWGTRAAFLVGIGSAGISAVLGIIVGGIAGWYGKSVGNIASRISEVFLVLPVFFMLIVLVSFFGASISIVMIAIGLTCWPRNARLMRAQVLSLKSRAFVQASIGIGASNMRILFMHVIPNGLYPVITNAALEIGGAILVEAGLSFLGLGDPNVISWGKMIFEGRAHLGSAPWIILFPGLAMITLVSALNLVGDGLNFILNPKLKREQKEILTGVAPSKGT